MISPLTAAVLAAVLALSPALAAVPEPASLCAIDDERLAELSGLAADRAGLWGTADDGKQVELHRLDLDDCAILDTRTAKIDPRDTEDLALGPDGALWLADTGDNDRVRENIAVMVVPARGQATLHRLSYPDGPHDAEALVVDAGGAPVIVTKEAGGPAGIYRTDGPPAGDGPTPLERVGELRLPASDSVGGPVGGLGSRLVTGAAVSADRRVVAVRTYTDAWLYAAPDGDVVAALTRPVAAPVRVPLPDEPQGEAIAFLPDGTLISGGETRNAVAGELHAVPGAAALAGGEAGEPTSAPGDVLDTGAAMPAWLPAALGVVAVVGFLALLTGALALRRR